MKDFLLRKLEEHQNVQSAWTMPAYFRVPVTSEISKGGYHLLPLDSCASPLIVGEDVTSSSLMSRGRFVDETSERQGAVCWQHDPGYDGEDRSFGFIAGKHLGRVARNGEDDLCQPVAVLSNDAGAGSERFPHVVGIGEPKFSFLFRHDFLPSLVSRFQRACRAFVNAWKVDSSPSNLTERVAS